MCVCVCVCEIHFVLQRFSPKLFSHTHLCLCSSTRLLRGIVTVHISLRNETLICAYKEVYYRPVTQIFDLQMYRTPTLT